MPGWLLSFVTGGSGRAGAFALIAAVVIVAGLTVGLIWFRSEAAVAKSARDTAVARLHEARTVFNATLSLKQTTINLLNATSGQQAKALNGLRDQVRAAEAASARLAADRRDAARIMATARPVCSDNSTLVVDRETSDRALQYLLGR